MHISISNSTRKYMSILQIEQFPFSEETLKTNFRALAKQYHPDTSGDDSKMFLKIREAFDSLINLASLVTPEDVNNELKKQEKAKEDMFELYDTCPKCNGLGNRVEQQIVRNTQSLTRVPCILCPPRKCNACDNGTFTQRNGRKVTCLKCKGLGLLPDKRCGWCGGKGTLKYQCEMENVTVKCMLCYGTGKVKVDPFNPVIPKGGIL